MADELTGEARVLQLADRARECGGIAPHALYHKCVEAFSAGEIGFDRVSKVYRHAAIHAGIIVPRDRARFCVCPECEAKLPPPDDPEPRAA